MQTSLKQSVDSKPVLIVGAGPVGQLAALLLSTHGIPSMLIDKRLTTLTAPKAHAVNPRTLEICESVGVSAARLRALGASANDGGDVRFVGTLTGPEFGSLPYERQDEAALAATPFPLSNIPQPVFEEELISVIRETADIDFRRGTECTGLVDAGDAVTATLVDTQSDEKVTLSFSYVIAADGAGSKIRQSLGVEMDGPEALSDNLMIHFSADLRALTEGKRGVLYFLFEPGVNGALIAYDHAGTWVLMHPWNPVTEKLEDYDETRCKSLIYRAIGQAVPDATIENVSPWTMSAQIARQYRTGRVFLAGDAAHRFPPTGGLGLNTGAGDVQNLTWKLASVLRGEAGEALLDTYDTERQPIARFNSEQSLTNAAKIFDLIVAIHGTDPEQAAERYAAVAADPGAFPELTDAVAAQKPHFDSFAAQLGYCYESPAIHGEVSMPEIADVSDYQPSWQTGAHFPHRWVQQGGETLPLQSLLAPNRFTLLRGPACAPTELCESLAQVRFGKDFEDPEDWPSLTGLPDAGALLIRPDGHIAARFESLEDDAVLASVMNEVLLRSA